MHRYRFLFPQKAVYFIGFLTAVSVALILILSTGKINCFLLMSKLHSKWLDQVFVSLTFLGDGLFNIIIAGALFFVSKLRRLSFHIITAYLLSGIAAQLIKRIFMAPRPREIIQSNAYSYFLDGITGAGWNSFPSGHTTSVFALATILSLYVHKKSWGVFFLMLAILVGYSRIYLGQHFLQDVLAGSVLGTTVGVIVYLFVNLPKNLFKVKPVSPAAAEEGGYSSRLAGN
jgi:membrane-associated phospholipid phosphatase